VLLVTVHAGRPGHSPYPGHLGAAFLVATAVPLTVLISAAAAAVVCIGLAALLGAHAGRAALRQRLEALASRLGNDPGEDDKAGVEASLSHLERATDLAAEAVAESSADAIRLRRAFDALQQGIVVCDENGTVVFRNAQAEALMTSRHGDVLAAEAVGEIVQEAWQAAEGGHLGQAERTIELYGPPRRTLAIRCSLIDDGRRTLGAMTAIDDISERRRLEEVRRDFVANVSHELKTPIGALGLLAETLVAEEDRVVTERLAGRIQSEAFRITRIIEDLLDLSRIEAEESPPREPVLMNLVMSEALERIHAAVEQFGVGVEYSEPDPPVTVIGDRRQLLSALYNLLENAVKYSYSGGVVELVGRQVGSSVEIIVRDHGIGIPARDLERIFERFYRVDQARGRQTGGTGLGLSIVRHVANNHGGTVEVESREGDGSTFVLKLPLHSVGAPAAGGDRGASAVSPAGPFQAPREPYVAGEAAVPEPPQAAEAVSLESLPPPVVPPGWQVPLTEPQPQAAAPEPPQAAPEPQPQAAAPEPPQAAPEPPQAAEAVSLESLPPPVVPPVVPADGENSDGASSPARDTAAGDTAAGDTAVGDPGHPEVATLDAGVPAVAYPATVLADSRGLGKVVPPDAGTPLTGTPSTGTPSTGTPSTGTPSTGTPLTGTPSTRPEDDTAPGGTPVISANGYANGSASGYVNGTGPGQGFATQEAFAVRGYRHPEPSEHPAREPGPREPGSDSQDDGAR